MKGEKKELYYILCIDDDDAFLDSLSMILPERLSKNTPEFNFKFEFINNVNDLFKWPDYRLEQAGRKYFRLV